jgi:hypothetical protein
MGNTDSLSSKIKLQQSLFVAIFLHPSAYVRHAHESHGCGMARLNASRPRLSSHPARGEFPIFALFEIFRDF